MCLKRPLTQIYADKNGSPRCKASNFIMLLTLRYSWNVQGPFVSRSLGASGDESDKENIPPGFVTDGTISFAGATNGSDSSPPLKRARHVPTTASNKHRFTAIAPCPRNVRMRSARSPSHVSDSEPEREREREREEAKGCQTQRIRAHGSMGTSPPHGALGRASPVECGFHSPGAPATRNVYRARHLVDGTVAIEAHTFHSSNEDNQYRVGLTPPKRNAFSRPTRDFDSLFKPKDNSGLTVTLPDRKISTNGTSELEGTKRHCLPRWNRWNDNDDEDPESRRVYYRRLRH